MGILRTNTVSGIETPTPVTGSVVFDGSGDYLKIDSTSDFAFATGNFTMECWYYPTGGTYEWLMDCRDVSTSQLGPAVYTASTTIRVFINGSVRIEATRPPQNNWHHVALVRNNGTTTLYVNGISQGTYSDSTNYVSTNFRIAGNEQNPPTLFGTQYSSNVRVLKGTALYTTNFTPPTRELQPIGDTVLLCCNNPDSAGAEATGKTIAVNGNAAASTFSPGLVRNFTFGTQFDGVTKFDTQGYFVPPSGTTEQRSRGRGVFGGGYIISGPTNVMVNTIEYVQIQTLGNAIDFGDLSVTRLYIGACSSSTRALFGGGYAQGGGTRNIIDYVTIAATGNAIDFGDLQTSQHSRGSCSSSTRGIWASGSVNNQIDYVTISSTGNAQDFGDYGAGNRRDTGGLSSPVRGVFGGGVPALTDIEYITIASTGDSIDFGDLTSGRMGVAAASSSVRGIFAGGTASPSVVGTNIIDYITIASTGNAIDFGDVTEVTFRSAGTSNGSRAVIVMAGGQSAPGPASSNTINYVNISTTGNAQDFGDATYSCSGNRTDSGTSDSHGGIS